MTNVDIAKFWRVMLGSYGDNPEKYFKYYQDYCRYHEGEQHGWDGAQVKRIHKAKETTQEGEVACV